MKKILIFLFAIASISAVPAQNSTTGITKKDSSLNGKNSVLVIPFESKLYLSDIDRDLGKANNLNFHDIKAKFRAALDREIFIALKPYFNPLSFYAIEPQESRAELGYIYNSIGYKYDLVPEEEVVKKQSVGKKFIGKFKKSKRTKDSEYYSETEHIKSGIYNGEIVSEIDNREKYMKTTLPNPKLLPNLNAKYKASHYIFINQLDIKRSADLRYVAREEEYKREIKVHYTIYDNSGNEVSSGAIKSRFPSNQNDIDKIIKIQFPLIAQRIVSNLLGSNAIVAE